METYEVTIESLPGKDMPPPSCGIEAPFMVSLKFNASLQAHDKSGVGPQQGHSVPVASILVARDKELGATLGILEMSRIDTRVCCVVFTYSCFDSESRANRVTESSRGLTQEQCISQVGEVPQKHRLKLEFAEFICELASFCDSG